jgi:hypothetical protein
MSDEIIAEGGREKDENKQTSGFVVEKVTYGKKVKITKRLSFIYQAVDKKNQQEKSPEIQAGKYHGGFLVEKKYIFQDLNQRSLFSAFSKLISKGNSINTNISFSFV